MRIAILAPSMALGIDGVADYSQSLAGGLRDRGHSTCLIRLNDFYGEGVEFSRGSDGLSILNLLAHSPWPLRSERVRRCLEEFAPEALIVQYYWHDFAAGGNHAGIGALLGGLGNRCRRQMLYHEIWDEVGTTSRIPHFMRHLLIEVRAESPGAGC